MSPVRSPCVRACVGACVCGWVVGCPCVHDDLRQNHTRTIWGWVRVCCVCVGGWVGWVWVWVWVWVCARARARVCGQRFHRIAVFGGGGGGGGVYARACRSVCVCLCVRACVFVCVPLKHRVPTRHAPCTCVVTRHLLKAPGYPRWLRRTHTREGVRCSCSTSTDFVTFLQLRPVSWCRRYERQAQPRPPRDCSCLGPRSGLQQCLQHARGCGIAHRARARAEAARRRVRRPGGSLRTSSGCRDGPPCADRER